MTHRSKIILFTIILIFAILIIIGTSIWLGFPCENYNRMTIVITLYVLGGGLTFSMMIAIPCTACGSDWW